MDAEELDGTIKTRAYEVVDALAGLTPCERALVWREVELALDELTITTTATIAQREAHEDADAVLTTWLGAVLRRLPPSAREQSVDTARELDDEARLSRLMKY